MTQKNKNHKEMTAFLKLFERLQRQSYRFILRFLNVGRSGWHSPISAVWRLIEPDTQREIYSVNKMIEINIVLDFHNQSQNVYKNLLASITNKKFKPTLLCLQQELNDQSPRTSLWWMRRWSATPARVKNNRQFTSGAAYSVKTSK